MVKPMVKHEQDNVQREDMSFGRDILGRALWQLSLVLRDIAATDGQAEEPKKKENKRPPHLNSTRKPKPRLGKAPGKGRENEEISLQSDSC